MAESINFADNGLDKVSLTLGSKDFTDNGFDLGYHQIRIKHSHIHDISLLPGIVFNINKNNNTFSYYTSGKEEKEKQYIMKPGKYNDKSFSDTLKETLADFKVVYNERTKEIVLRCETDFKFTKGKEFLKMIGLDDKREFSKEHKGILKLCSYPIIKVYMNIFENLNLKHTYLGDQRITLVSTDPERLYYRMEENQQFKCVEDMKLILGFYDSFDCPLPLTVSEWTMKTTLVKISEAKEPISDAKTG
jgi:hypothetical protein